MRILLNMKAGAEIPDQTEDQPESGAEYQGYEDLAKILNDMAERRAAAHADAVEKMVEAIRSTSPNNRVLVVVDDDQARKLTAFGDSVMAMLSAAIIAAIMGGEVDPRTLAGIEAISSAGINQRGGKLGEDDVAGALALAKETIRANGFDKEAGE
jgi:hypothetical protein